MTLIRCLRLDVAAASERVKSHTDCEPFQPARSASAVPFSVPRFVEIIASIASYRPSCRRASFSQLCGSCAHRRTAGRWFPRRANRPSFHQGLDAFEYQHQFCSLLKRVWSALPLKRPTDVYGAAVSSMPFSAQSTSPSSTWRNRPIFGSTRIAEYFIYLYQKLRHPRGDGILFGTFSFNILLFSAGGWVA